MSIYEENKENKNKINKININLDNYYLNPYKFNFINNLDNQNNSNNLNITKKINTQNKLNNFDNLSNKDNDLSMIIQTLTSIIMSNSSKNDQSKYLTNEINNTKKNLKNDLINNSINNVDNTLFKLIANNKMNQLNNIIKNKNLDIDVQDEDGDTPLHLSVFLCNIKACEILLSNGASTYIKDKWGQIPLHRICFCVGEQDVIKIINLFCTNENKNLDTNYLFNNIDIFGNTPFHLVLNYLIKNNVSINNNHIKLIKKLKLLTNNNIINKDNQSIYDLLNILCL